MDLLFLIGRVLFGGLFLFNGLNHLLHYEATRGYIAYKQVPLPAAATIVSASVAPRRWRKRRHRVQA